MPPTAVADPWIARLTEWMHTAGLAQQELAALLDVDPTNLSRVLAGHRRAPTSHFERVVAARPAAERARWADAYAEHVLAWRGKPTVEPRAGETRGVGGAKGGTPRTPRTRKRPLTGE